ncbi:AMP-dependent synthetase/ligase [Sporichthya polymorpha]|uniref:AMP-dependent synthetase/ligase n=1 Tax=Sporichthya polymorpha TaxID=35751 RepID=UPI00037044CA|nr:long-chain fatty acid--CoA ligase [Sporichthya polymorpha]
MSATAGSTADHATAASIPGLLVDRVARTPNAKAFSFRSGNGWADLTWAQAQDRVRALAAGLIGLGVGAETRVAILSSTRVEWVLGDLAILAAGGATTTIYPSNTADECAFVLTDSDTQVVIAENDEQVAKLRSVRDQIPSVRAVVVMDGAGDGDWVHSFADLEEGGAKRPEAEPAAYTERVAAITGDRLATLMYTSGTTGRPKGVELTHDNWVYVAEAVMAVAIVRPDDLHFLWLPMSHSFGKALVVMMIAAGAPTAIDGSVDRIAANLGELRPTVVAAAPRVFEKIHNTIAATVRGEGGVKAQLFGWARGVGLAATKARQAGKSPSLLTQIQLQVADRLVLSKIRGRFGGRIRYFISGSAPLSPEIAEFFDAAGMTILEGYGLTESSAASFVNRPGAAKFGTVGPPLPGTEVKIAEDGEVLFRSRGIMRGYHGLPEETAATLLDGGWLATGDIGELDEVGRLRITDRKKELIKTSGGKYVAPAPIESSIKATCPYVGNVVVHGDRRNFCVALVTLDPDVTKPWAEANGLGADAAAWAANETVRAEVRRAIDEVNSSLPSYSTIKDFAILPNDFTVETGELTASMKVRRKTVESKYADVLDTFYAGTISSV